MFGCRGEPADRGAFPRSRSRLAARGRFVKDVFAPGQHNWNILRVKEGLAVNNPVAGHSLCIERVSVLASDNLTSNLTYNTYHTVYPIPREHDRNRSRTTYRLAT